MSNENSNMTPGAEDYDADSIKVLRGLDAVRKRSGHVYRRYRRRHRPASAWSTRSSTMRSTRRWPGYCDRAMVELHADGSVSVRDNGRGVPTGIHTEEGISAANVIFTQLHAGGKFDNTGDDNAYKVSGGLHGVGAARRQRAVRAMLELVIWRNGKEHCMRFALRRSAEGSRRCAGAESGRWPSRAPDVTFLAVQRDLHERHRIRFRHARAPAARTRLPQLGRPHPAARRARRGARSSTTCSTRAGSRPFVKYLDRNKQPLLPDPIAISSERDGIGIDVALRVERHLLRKRPLLHQQHPPARRRHSPRRFPRGADPHRQFLFRESPALLKKEKVSLTGEDMREGLTCDRFRSSCPTPSSLRRPRTSWSPPKCASRSKA